MDDLIVKEGDERIDAELLPPRISIENQSKFFCLAAAGVVGVRLDGREVDECVEYCVGEGEDFSGKPLNGWVRVGNRMTSGKLQRSAVKGEQFATTTLYGKVEPFFKVKPSRQVRRQIARIGK